MALTKEQQEWVDALRSGKFKQGKSYLQCETGFCCLGVGSEIFCKRLGLTKGVDPFLATKKVIAYQGDVHSAPIPVQNLLHLRGKYGEFSDDYVEKIYDAQEREIQSLADMNDADKSFEEIADFIEANPMVVFTQVA